MIINRNQLIFNIEGLMACYELPTESSTHMAVGNINTAKTRTAGHSIPVVASHGPVASDEISPAIQDGAPPPSAWQQHKNLLCFRQLHDLQINPVVLGRLARLLSRMALVCPSHFHRVPRGFVYLPGPALVHWLE